MCYLQGFTDVANLIFFSGMLKIHSGGSSSPQTVLTIPANQLKQLGVGTGSGGLQTLLMPVGKGEVNHKGNVDYIKKTT